RERGEEVPSDAREERAPGQKRLGATLVHGPPPALFGRRRPAAIEADLHLLQRREPFDDVAVYERRERFGLLTGGDDLDDDGQVQRQPLDPDGMETAVRAVSHHPAEASRFRSRGPPARATIPETRRLHGAPPKSRPTPAVRAIAEAPQKVTRAAPM